MDIKKMINDIKGELINIRRDFHINPELGGSELRTMHKICEYLDSWGIEYKKGIAETGIVAIIRGKHKGRTIGIRADMDALPIKEANDVSYKSSIEGAMHACGHDAHMTVALGAARILKSMESDLKGNVKFFFQPAEETTGGAERMIKEGCLKNPEVDYVIGLHVDPGVRAGKISIKYGKMMASSDEIEITVRGKSTHGANPHEGVDPIFIASSLVVSLQSIVSRNLAPSNSAVLTIGSIHGGTRCNIIPDEVIMKGIIRTLDYDTRVYIKNRIKETVEKISAALGGEGIAVFHESYGSLINDSDTVNVVRNVAVKLLGEENVIINEFPSMGTEDFSYFSQSVKSCFFNLGCKNEEINAVYPLHSSRFDIDENCLVTGVLLQVVNALELLMQN